MIESKATSNGLSVLVVEDDAKLRSALTALASRIAASCAEAGTVAAARERLCSERFDTVLVDVSLPDGSGLDLVGDPDVIGAPEFVVITGNGSAETAVRALERGALDYLIEPIDRGRLRSVLVNVERTLALKHQVSGLRGQLRELGCFGALVGRSAAMQKVYELIERVAPTDASVLITGESGTGKELVAQTVHHLSRRQAAPFVAVNCGAMAPSLIESELFGHEKGSFTGADRKRLGYFERADGGTLFLDEITEMPLELQVKLLRVLEVGAVTRVGSAEVTPVNVRVLAASNRDPAKAVEDGALREDLLYRLNVFPIELPPLRQRDGDIALLSEHFLHELNAREGTAKRFTPRALARLQELRWAGNVRELKNAVERAWILADAAIDLDALPAEKASDSPEPRETSMLQIRVGTPLSEVERRVIQATLQAMDGNKTRVAELLGISLKTLYNRLNVYQARARGERVGSR